MRSPASDATFPASPPPSEAPRLHRALRGRARRRRWSPGLDLAGYPRHSASRASKSADPCIGPQLIPFSQTVSDVAVQLLAGVV